MSLSNVHSRTVARKSSIGRFTFVHGGLNAKTLFIYIVSYFNLERGLELCFGGISLPKPPMVTGLVHSLIISLISQFVYLWL